VETETGDRIKQPRALSNKFDEFLSRKGFKNVEKTDINVHLIFGNTLNGKIKGAVRRIDPTASKFDFELISTVPYNRKHTISKETLQLHDFAEITEDFANQQNLPRYPATPLNDEKTPLADVVDMDSVSGVKTANPANPVVHPAKIGDFLARKMADLKQAQDNPNAT